MKSMGEGSGRCRLEERPLARPVRPLLSSLFWLGALCAACSAPPRTTEFKDDPGVGVGRQSIDPTKPGAAILCSSEEQGATLLQLSAMNHKLAAYPEFAQAIGLELVSDCESANQFMSGYAAYSAEHVDFDAREPLPPGSDVELPPPPSLPPPGADGEISKIAGGEEGIVNHPVVNIGFSTCSSHSCQRADESWIIKRPGEADIDLRHFNEVCTGTFIAKNWILTAAHCISPVAIDSCMERGDTLADCTPAWDDWGFWTIRGTRPNSAVLNRLQFWARAYVIGGWLGRTLADPLAGNPLTCTTNCFDTDLGADDDLALLYVPMLFDDELFPNIENNGAKRLSAGTPEADWQLAFYGWGLPASINPQTGMQERILRRGANFFDTFKVLPRRIEITATSARPFACAGDSGGPMMHTGLELDTNNGVQQGLEAIVGVTSAARPDCKTLPGPGNPAVPVFWNSVRMDIPEHQQFITDTMHRYPQWRNFACKARGLVGLEAEECWGPPCTNDSGPDNGGCPLTTQTCINPGRTVASQLKKFSCAACDGTSDQGSCDCIVGQCLSK